MHLRHSVLSSVLALAASSSGYTSHFEFVAPVRGRCHFELHGMEAIEVRPGCGEHENGVQCVVGDRDAAVDVDQAAGQRAPIALVDRTPDGARMFTLSVRLP